MLRSTTPLLESSCCDAASGSTTKAARFIPSIFSFNLPWRSSTIHDVSFSNFGLFSKPATSTDVFVSSARRNALRPRSPTSLPSNSSDTSVELLLARASDMAMSPSSPIALLARYRSTIDMFCSRHDARALAPLSPTLHPRSQSCRTWVLSDSASASRAAPPLPMRRPDRSMPVTWKSSSISLSNSDSKFASNCLSSSIPSICADLPLASASDPHPDTSSARIVRLCSSAPIRYITPASPSVSFPARDSTARVSLVIRAVPSDAAPSVPTRLPSRSSSASVPFFLSMLASPRDTATSVMEQFRSEREVTVRLSSIALDSLITSQSPSWRSSRLIALMDGSADVRTTLSIWGGMRFPGSRGMNVGLLPSEDATLLLVRLALWSALWV